jgi:L-lysine 2,3-aminomutase
MDDINKCLDYIRKTPVVRDVLLSGGDCLLVDDDVLEYIISELRKIPHVEIVRMDPELRGYASENHRRSGQHAEEVSSQSG